MAYFTKNEDGTFTEVTEALIPESKYTELKAKNNELRTTNTNLLKTNETLSAFAEVLDGVQNITPDGLMKKIEEKASKHAEKLVADMKSKHDDTVRELNEKLTVSSTQLSKFMLGQEVQKAGAKHGVIPTAYDDVLRRAESDFVVKDGKVCFKEEKLDADGNPYSVDVWMADQAKVATHLFAPAQGPAAQRNTATRTQIKSTEKRSANELLLSGLSQRK